MSADDTQAFLRLQSTAYVATTGADGWPYVVPLMYVYEEGDRLYLHTGARSGHFCSNVTGGAKISIAVTEPGAMQRGKPSACNSSLPYRSAIVFGHVRVCDGDDLGRKKSWFFDRLLERLGDSPENYASSYTMLQQIILYEVAIEALTGKINVGLHH